MPEISIDFPNNLNVSVQVGDIAYFILPVPRGQLQTANPLSNTSTPHMTGDQQDIIKIGEITELNCCAHAIPATPTTPGGHIICDMEQDIFNTYYATLADTLIDRFIMFSKDNKANTSSVLGYYASAQFRNNSTDEAELFNVGVDVFESSK